MKNRGKLHRKGGEMVLLAVNLYTPTKNAVVSAGQPHLRFQATNERINLMFLCLFKPVVKTEGGLQL
jgi:hypothetical protein